jgi:predicted RNase H-like nuclease (RuvC/YqgF family)
MSQDNLMKYVPVEVNKWAEMVQAMTRVKELEADLEKSDGVVWTLTIENTHLKAELTDLKSTADRFKAEVESLMTNPTSRLLRAEREENARLKAEVERLESDIKMEKENEDRLVREWQKANNEVYGLQTQVAALIDDQTRLKSEVERLTKAGDAIYQSFDQFVQVDATTLKGWLAAKGVQS